MLAYENAAASLVVVPFRGWKPEVGERLKAHPTARIVGRTRIGSDCVLGGCATIRGDGERIQIGDHCSFGRHATVHVAHETLPTRIGAGVTVGPGAVIHAADIADDVVIGEGAVVMDGASVSKGAVIARNALVVPGRVLEGDMLYAGAPALPVRKLNPGELAVYRRTERLSESGRIRHGAKVSQRRPAIGLPGGGRVLICDNVYIEGEIQFEVDVSLWYGATVINPSGRIEIGARSNIQDNAVVRLHGESVLLIGNGVTVGHNATLEASQIMDGALVGMGAHVTHGTIIEEGACLAAGAVTRRNAVIRRGMLWAGRPARPIRMLTEEERADFLWNLNVYCDDYLDAYTETMTGELQSFYERRTQCDTD